VGFDINKMLVISKKEFADNIRNRWIIILTVIFVSLTIAASIVAGGGEIGSMDDTVAGLLSIASLLIPIIGIMLGYGTISGEANSGALAVVLSYPVKRAEVLFGKFLGLGSVLSLSVLLGFGLSGVVIAATTDAQWGGYLVFIGLSILLGLVFLSLSLCCSAILKRRVASLGAGIVVFFFGMIVGLVFLGYLQATGGDTMDLIMGNFENIPDWFWFDPFLSPMDGYQTASTQAFDISEVFGYRMDLPEFLNMPNIVISQLLWLFIPLILAYLFFERRDI